MCQSEGKGREVSGGVSSAERKGQLLGPSGGDGEGLKQLRRLTAVPGEVLDGGHGSGFTASESYV